MFGDSRGGWVMDDLCYYIERERAERGLAEQATDEKARAIHLALALNYADIIRQLRGETGTPWNETLSQA